MSAGQCRHVDLYRERPVGRSVNVVVASGASALTWPSGSAVAVHRQARGMAAASERRKLLAIAAPIA